MFPWMKGQISEAWHSRKNSRSAKKPSLNSSSRSKGVMQTSSTSEESFRVNVISLEGNNIFVPVKLDYTIEKVKSLATEFFYGDKKNKSPLEFRLVHGRLLKPLTDKHNLEEEDISESDELLLVEVRPPAPKENLSEEALKGPTEEKINNVTKNLPTRNPPKRVVNTESEADFQEEIRKIIITLVKTSAKILMYSPDAIKFYDIIKEKLEAQSKPPNDPKAVKYLVEMGFSERKVLKALRLRKMNTSEALEWLLEHIDDLDDEEDLHLPSLDSLAEDEPGPSSGALANARKSSIRESVVRLFKKNNEPVKKQPNLVRIVDLLLENLRQFSKLNFKPSPSLIKSLESMGFEKKEIIETLKITGNNQANACAWLLGERTSSIQNMYEGMDPDGPIYSAIMSNPLIQLSLTNPRMLLAYLSMLETPMSTSLWMKDPHVAPILHQIFKMYHAEKHAIQVNRYDST